MAKKMILIIVILVFAVSLAMAGIIENYGTINTTVNIKGILFEENFEDFDSTGWEWTNWTFESTNMQPHTGDYYAFAANNASNLTTPEIQLYGDINISFWYAAENKDVEKNLRVWINNEIIFEDLGFKHTEYKKVTINVEYEGYHKISFDACNDYVDSGFGIDDIVIEYV